VFSPRVLGEYMENIICSLIMYLMAGLQRWRERETGSVREELAGGHR
jgi:hypothetical protein